MIQVIVTPGQVLRYVAFPLHSSYESTFFQIRTLSTLDIVGTSSIESGDPENIGVGVGIVQLRHCSADMCGFSSSLQLRVHIFKTRTL